MKKILLVLLILLSTNTVLASSQSCEILNISLNETYEEDSQELNLKTILDSGYEKISKHSLNIMKGTEILVQLLQDQDFDKAEPIAYKISQERGNMRSQLNFLNSIPLNNEELAMNPIEETEGLFDMIVDQTNFATKTIISKKLGYESLHCI